VALLFLRRIAQFDWQSRPSCARDFLGPRLRPRFAPRPANYGILRLDAALEAILRLDDRVQAALFSRQRLAESYPASAITRPFRFNAYYAEWQVRPVADDWVLSLGGLVADRRPWTLQKLMALPQQGQITRHICIEGWSQIGQWSGVPLSAFLRRVGADLSARHVNFKCFDGY
jgi:DMSO/TMAO reductase YedYZ molybdopterin-dependent catalytic subunit